MLKRICSIYFRISFKSWAQLGSIIFTWATTCHKLKQPEKDEIIHIVSEKTNKYKVNFLQSGQRIYDSWYHFGYLIWYSSSPSAPRPSIQNFWNNRQTHSKQCTASTQTFSINSELEKSVRAFLKPKIQTEMVPKLRADVLNFRWFQRTQPNCITFTQL